MLILYLYRIILARIGLVWFTLIVEGIKMTEKLGRNDLCSCGSGKKFKKCCGMQKKLSTRETSVIASSSAPSLLERIKGGSSSKEENPSSLRERVNKLSGRDIATKSKYMKKNH
jgi:hypothetical protein